METLQEYKDLARRSYNWTSFSPERRGDQLISDYTEELNNDVAELEKAEIEAGIIGDYVARYKRLFSSWLHAKCGTFSMMITGGSKFPVRKHEKANRSEERHYQIFNEWRTRAKKAIVRKAQPEKTFLSEIDRLRADLESRKKNQETMKTVNAVIRKAKGKDCTAELLAAGIGPKLAAQVQQPNSWGDKGFPAYSLTNNNANIKRIEARVKELEAKEEKRNDNQDREYLFEGGRVLINYEADRVQIFHDQKPDRSTIDKIKSNGFNFSFRETCWQRKITSNAIWATREVTGLDIRLN